MLYMNQKTYDELTEAIVMHQPPTFLPVLICEIDPVCGVDGFQFSIDNNLPDKTLYLNAPDIIVSSKMESIMCKLKVFMPNLKVV